MRVHELGPALRAHRGPAEATPGLKHRLTNQSMGQTISHPGRLPLIGQKASRLAVHLPREGALTDKSVMLGRVSGSHGQFGLTLEAADKARCSNIDARLATVQKICSTGVLPWEC